MYETCSYTRINGGYEIGYELLITRWNIDLTYTLNIQFDSKRITQFGLKFVVACPDKNVQRLIFHTCNILF